MEKFMGHSRILLFLLLSVMLTFINSCSLVSDIFEAGVWLGVIISVVVVALLIYLFVKILKKIL